MKKLLLSLAILSLLATGCGLAAADTQATVIAQVNATVAAIPPQQIPVTVEVPVPQMVEVPVTVVVEVTSAGKQAPSIGLGATNARGARVFPAPAACRERAGSGSAPPSFQPKSTSQNATRACERGPWTRRRSLRQTCLDGEALHPKIGVS